MEQTNNDNNIKEKKDDDTNVSASKNNPVQKISKLSDDNCNVVRSVVGKNNIESKHSSKNNIKQQLSSSSPFIEILPPKKERVVPERIEVYISEVQPKFCGKLIKELNAILPLRKKEEDVDDCGGEESMLDLGHLRRVRRSAVPTTTTTETTTKEDIKGGGQHMANNDDENKSQTKEEPPKKRKKKNTNINNKKSNKGNNNNMKLEILLGSKSQIDNSSANLPTKISSLISTYQLQNPLPTKLVPGRPAQSQEELDKFNAIWPTLYHYEKTSEFKNESLKLSEKEICEMKHGMKEAILDAKMFKKQWVEYKKIQKVQGKEKNATAKNLNEKSPFPCTILGGGAVIVNPKTNQVVSRSSTEQCKQQEEQQQYHYQYQKQQQHNATTDIPCIFPAEANPLCTSVLLAIQGVSRLERLVAIGQGMDSDEFQKGQYLCTGYDVYTTREPSVYESMALVHSRVRRVIFGVVNSDDGGLGGSGHDTAVHCLPGTNHHYRAFRFCSASSSSCDVETKRCGGGIDDNDNTMNTSNCVVAIDNRDIDRNAESKNDAINKIQDGEMDNTNQIEEVDIYVACLGIHTQHLSAV